MRIVRTELLEIAFEEGGPPEGAAVLLLHGWPDAPCGWEFVASRLQAEGWRTVTPYLRGSGATRFLSEETPRVGAAVALAQDAVDLAADRVLAVDLRDVLHAGSAPALDDAARLWFVDVQRLVIRLVGADGGERTHGACVALRRVANER